MTIFWTTTLLQSLKKQDFVHNFFLKNFDKYGPDAALVPDPE
jgi:hypothetical protein